MSKSVKLKKAASESDNTVRFKIKTRAFEKQSISLKNFLLFRTCNKKDCRFCSNKSTSMNSMASSELIRNIARHCAKNNKNFIGFELPFSELIFRTLIANENVAMSAKEIFVKIQESFASVMLVRDVSIGKITCTLEKDKFYNFTTDSQ